MEWAYDYAPEIQRKGARFGLTIGAFPPSSVYLDSRIAEGREMLTDPHVDEVFFIGLGL